MSHTQTEPEALNQQHKVILGTVFGIILANIAVGLRFIARRVGQLELRLDDYFMCMALVRAFRSSSLWWADDCQVFHWGIAVAGILREGILYMST